MPREIPTDLIDHCGPGIVTVNDFDRYLANLGLPPLDGDIDSEGSGMYWSEDEDDDFSDSFYDEGPRGRWGGWYGSHIWATGSFYLNSQ